MPEQSKFENVDVTASLEAIMKQNTGFYQSDLEIDKEIIAKAAASPHREDKTLLWFCRPSGTHCFRERDVFLKDTAPHNTWRFYMEQTSDRPSIRAQLKTDKAKTAPKKAAAKNKNHDMEPANKKSSVFLKKLLMFL